VNLIPPLPGWDGLHPLIVHFPIALLLVAPMFVIAALVFRSMARAFLIAAFSLMVFGSIATWIAVGTGDSASDVAEHARVSGGQAAGAQAVIDQHEDLAQTTRTIFSVLTVLFGLVVFVPLAARRRFEGVAGATVTLAFLSLYTGGLVFLVNTAHQGGRLVHEFGVRATMTPVQKSGGIQLQAQGLEDEREEAAREQAAMVGHVAPVVRVPAAPAGAEPAGPAGGSARGGTPVAGAGVKSGGGAY